MSEAPTPSHHTAPAETGPAHVEAHELTQTQAQSVQSPVSTTYPELPEDWKSGLSLEGRRKAREKDFTEEERRDAWKVVDQAVKTYSDEMVQRWIAEMDTLLVYAGLFSAVLTAFNVESYLLLSPSAPDPVLAALTQISAQLASFSVQDPFVNSTQPAFQPSSVPSNSNSAQKWAVWLNALWFSSLICSLSAASIAIMVKQWIHEYNSGISGTSHHTARLRQHRYNGLVQWKVAAIIAVLPILLQIALGLFLAGILVLLWNLNCTVAIIASTLIGALLAFTLVTIILPSFTANCGYLSPLSISLFRSYRLIFTAVRSLINEAAYSVRRTVPSGSILCRISNRLLLLTYGKSLPPSIYAMQSAHVTMNPRELDQDGFVTAYSTTGDLSLLEQASTCFSDHPIDELSEFLTRIHAQNREYGQPVGLGSHWTQYIPLDMASDMLLVRECNTLGASGVASGQNASSLQKATGTYLSFSHAVPGDHRISYVLSNIAAVLCNDGNPHSDSFPIFRHLYALRRQVNSIKKTNGELTDILRKRVIAAIHTVLRSRTHNAIVPPVDSNVFLECALCLHILIACSSPITSGSQPGDMAEEDLKWKPLSDAIALAEDAVIRALQSPQFRDYSSARKYIGIKNFFEAYQKIGLEQLAGRVSEKMLRALVVAVQGLQSQSDYDQAWRHGLLEWLQLLEKERNKQIAAESDERTRASSRIA